MKVKEIIKRNSVFILLGIIAICCFIKKDSYLPMNIISEADSYVTFSAMQGSMEQTWLSEVKEISQVQISCVPVNDFEDEITMKVFEAQNRTQIASATQYVEFYKGMERDIQFEFQPFNVKAGEQYIFQISFNNQTADNQIEVKSGSNYMGCTIGEESQGQGLDLKITYIKNSRIFWLFISLFPFIGFSLLFMMLWGRKWEETVGMSMTGSIFIMYIAGLFGKLELGIYSVYLLSLICLIWGIIVYNKKGTSIKEFLSPGVVIFMCMIILILVNCNNARLARWDEFSHWGLAVKDMFYSNSFAKHFDSTVALKYYPPAATLMEYFFCYTNELYTDKMAYVGYQVFSLGLLIAGVGACKNKKLGTIISATMMLFLLPLVFFGDVYNSLYVDPLLAFGVAYVLICYYTAPITLFNVLRIVLGLFSLTMIKDTGAVLAGVLTLVMLGDELYKQYKEKTVKVKNVIFPLTCTFFVCTIFLVWQIYLSIPIERTITETDHVVQENVMVEQSEVSQSEMTKNAEEQGGIEQNKVEQSHAEESIVEKNVIDNNIEVQEKAEQNETMNVNGAIGASGISLDGIIELLQGNAPDYKYTVIKNYVEKICSENVYVFGSVSFSYMDLSVAILVLMLICSQINLFKHEENKFLSFGVLTFIAGLGYCGFLLITYLFAFSQEQALILTSYVRYLGSYICGVVLAAGVIILVSASEEKKVKYNILILGLCGLVMIVTPFEKFLIKNMDTELVDDQIYGYAQLAEILRTGAKKGDLVYYVCNNSDGYSNRQFENAIVPIKSSANMYNLFGTKENYLEQKEIYSELGIEEKGNPRYATADEWMEQLKTYDYVVIFHSNDVFKDTYEKAFKQPETIGNGTVYCVEKLEEGVTLKYIGKTGIKTFR